MDSKLILDFYKLPEFQKLNAYYMQSTVFNVLGIQRSENRHSAFLAWLLNPDAPHSLKEMPLRKFLALIAAKADDQDSEYGHGTKSTHRGALYDLCGSAHSPTMSPSILLERRTLL